MTKYINKNKNNNITLFLITSFLTAFNGYGVIVQASEPNSVENHETNETVASPLQSPEILEININEELPQFVEIAGPPPPPPPPMGRMLASQKGKLPQLAEIAGPPPPPPILGKFKLLPLEENNKQNYLQKYSALLDPIQPKKEKTVVKA